MTKKKIDFSVLKRPTVVCVNYVDIELIVNSDFVKLLREKNNYTQVRLANIIGVSKKAVEKWEQGANPIASPSARLMFLLKKYPQLAEEFVISNVHEKISLYEEISSNENYQQKVTPTAQSCQSTSRLCFAG